MLFRCRCSLLLKWIRQFESSSEWVVHVASILSRMPSSKPSNVKCLRCFRNWVVDLLWSIVDNDVISLVLHLIVFRHNVENVLADFRFDLCQWQSHKNHMPHVRHWVTIFATRWQSFFVSKPNGTIFSLSVVSFFLSYDEKGRKRKKNVGNGRAKTIVKSIRFVQSA